MKAKILFGLLCLIPTVASAAIPYRVEQLTMPSESKSGQDSQAFARDYRFYVGGSYDLSFGQNLEMAKLNTKMASDYEGFVGVRLFDTFRLEANYIRHQTNWEVYGQKILGLESNIAMANVIFDARIGNLYRPFRKQMLVPYVGLGGGIAWNSYPSDYIKISSDIKPVFGALAGIGIEFGNRFTLDLGYRYMYMPKVEIENPINMELFAHQIRLGARLNF